MSDVELLFHDEMCCDDTEPHAHVGEENGTTFVTLGRHEWRGEDADEVVAAMEEFLKRQEPQ